jgi:phage/plasmid-associated DNA primase
MVLEAAARVEARGGYKIPASSKAVVNRWRRTADQVAAYADEKLEKLDDHEDDAQATLAGYVYDNYRLWARRNGHSPLSHRKFAERLSALNFRRAQRISAGQRWRAKIAVNH